MAYGIFKPCIFPDHNEEDHMCEGYAQLLDEERKPFSFPTVTHAKYYIENTPVLYGDMSIVLIEIEEDEDEIS